MTKILIISYFFPPSNFVGGERADSWFKFLRQEGFYPIVVTRCWNKGQNDILGEIEQNEYAVEQLEGGEIHRVPILNDPRNKLKEGLFRKLITLYHLLRRNKQTPVNEFKPIFEKCVNILNHEREIKYVIASGRPFESFQLGYLLKKDFNIQWIPDYRDEWNTHQAPSNDSWIWKKIKKREINFEKVWTSNADHFITVSSAWQKRIGDFINKEGTVIMNGYDSLRVSSLTNKEKDESLHLLYCGTLYASQRIELIIQNVKFLQQEGNKIQLTFIGTEMMPEQKQRLLFLTKGMPHVKFYDRMSKTKLSKYQQKADVLFMTAFENVDGWLPVKLFDYYSSGKPILVCPSDYDIIDQFIANTNSGVSIQDPVTLQKQLEEWCKMKENGHRIEFKRKVKAGENYSRAYQAKQLANLLKSLQ